MDLTEKDVIRVAEIDEELFIFDASDEAMERAAGAADSYGRVVTLIYSTECAGGCACPV